MNGFRVFLIFALTFVFCSGAFAHKMFVYADYESGKISVFAYYGNGKPVANARVEIYKDNRLVVKGSTNNDGEYVYAPSETGLYKVVVVGRDGHRSETELNIGTGEVSGGSIESGEGVKHAGVNGSLCNTGLENEIKSIHDEIRKIRVEMQKVKLKDIIGGVGWIIGIFGAVAFVISYRKDRK